MDSPIARPPAVRPRRDGDPPAVRGLPPVEGFVSGVRSTRREGWVGGVDSCKTIHNRPRWAPDFYVKYKDFMVT